MHESLTERWNRVSLRSKITGVTVLLLTLGLLVSGIGTMAMLRQSIIENIEDRLQAEAQGLNDRRLEALTTIDSDSEFYVAVFDNTGTMLDRTWRDHTSSQLPVLPSALDLQSVSEMTDSTQTLRNPEGDVEFLAVAVPYTVGGQGQLGTVVMAISLEPTEKTMATYLTIFLGFGIGVVIVGAMLTRFLVTRTFLPLRDVERTAAAIADGDFSQRLGGATPNTEVGRLNRSLNTMLSRIDRAFKDRARTIEQMRRFVGDASHELRTPLVSVRGYAELYRMGALQSPEEVAQAMERIEKEAIRMGGLVEDLLELARLDETKPLALEPVDLMPLARDAALDAMASSPGRIVRVVATTPSEFEDTTAEPQPAIELAHSTGHLTHASDAQIAAEAAGAAANPAGRRQTVATLTGPTSFAGATMARFRTRRPRKADTAALAPKRLEQPVATEERLEAIVMGEENKIRQVITNLMGNALRFTSPDTPVELEVCVDNRNQRAAISVIDHGEGIPPQIREKIFQRFWRADTSRARETGGSGLGLAIVASIVASHNGSVEVLDTPGGGSTFRVWFPLAWSPNAPQPLTSSTLN